MDVRIESFLNRIEEQLYTQEEAEDIRLEIYDHIISLKEDFLESGYTEDESITKALLQMGDPKQIGYSFTDYEYIKKRKNAFIGIRIIAVMIYFATMLFAREGGFKDGIQFTDVFLPYLLLISSLATSLFNGYKLKYLDISSQPLLILWPTRNRFYWEVILLFVFFLPLTLIFLFLYFYEATVSLNSIVSLWPLLTIGLSAFMFYQGNKLRFPKYMVLSDGLVLKGRLFTWTSIASYSWSKEFMSKSANYYKLRLNLFQQGTDLKLNHEIHINKRQYNHLQRILKDQLI